MSAPDLREALRLVETLGLAPLARVYSARPKTFYDSAGSYSRWAIRKRGAEAEVADKLAEHGASIAMGQAPVRVRFAGVSASSTMGLESALRNWKAGVEKRLSKGGRR